MREAYIVNSVRTPGCRRGKGALAQTRPEELLVQALDAVIDRAPGVEKDVIVVRGDLAGDLRTGQIQCSQVGQAEQRAQIRLWHS